jgi:hypothetical protein
VVGLTDRINGPVKSAIDALRSNPLLLVVVLLNVLFIMAGLLYLRAEQHQMDTVLTACLNLGKR